MRDASLKQRIPCIIRISIFGAFSAEKSAHYTQVNTVYKHLTNKKKLTLFRFKKENALPFIHGTKIRASDVSAADW